MPISFSAVGRRGSFVSYRKSLFLWKLVSKCIRAPAFNIVCGSVALVSLSVLRILLGFCIYAAHQIHTAVFVVSSIRHFFAEYCKYLAKWLLYPANLLDDLTSAVEGFNREGSDSWVGLEGCVGVEVASLEWGQAPKPPSFVALRATTQSTRWSLL